MKAAFFSYLRFSRRVYYVASECGVFSSDMLFSSKNQLHEVEIKTSYSDFMADFRKHKHEFYEGNLMAGRDSKDSISDLPQYVRDRIDFETKFIPNFFCFAVPEELLPRILPKLKEYPQYGIYVVLDVREPQHKHRKWNERVKLVKRPKLIHNENVTSTAKGWIAARMSSELANLWMHKVK